MDAVCCYLPHYQWLECAGIHFDWLEVTLVSGLALSSLVMLFMNDKGVESLLSRI